MSEHDKTLGDEPGCLLRAADARELLEYLEQELRARGYLPGVMVQVAGSIMLTISCAVADEYPRDMQALKQALHVLQTVTQSVIDQTWRYWKAAQSAEQAQKQQGN